MSDAEHQDRSARLGLAQARARVAAQHPGGLDGVAGLLRQVCGAVAADLPGMGVAVSLMSDDGPIGVAAASDEASRAADELQITAGDGPCYDAYAARRPVLVPDLRSERARWPGFTSMALAAEVAAVFAYPLRLGSGVGVMDVFSEQAGPLSAEQDRLVRTYLQLVTDDLVDGDLVTPAGELDGMASAAFDGRAEIHQAQGMTMVDLSVGPADALSRMRAHAFAHDTSLADLAREIVAGFSLAEQDDH